jgi:UDP-N-acetylglucosamine 4,6-dehydratase
MNILVVGGTGTLGRELIKHYTEHGHAVYCLSRDELKQQELKKLHPEVNFILGDVRDGLPLIQAPVDILYYVAALKHIDVLENNIEQALSTNVLGTIKTAKDAIKMGIPKFAFSSTDKAVAPINVYGHTKALCEKYLAHLNAVQSETKFYVFRWGNVIGSRGSVVHAFAKSILEKKPVNITDKYMTRFWIRIEDAVKFMVSKTEGKPKSDVLIPDMKAASVLSLLDAVAKKVGVYDYSCKTTGIRPGEKIHETICNGLSSQFADRYTDQELLSLLEGVL